MVPIEEIERKLLALPLRHRVFLADSLLASVLPAAPEMTQEEELAEAERREREIATRQVRALRDAEFWRQVEANLRRVRKIGCQEPRLGGGDEIA